MWQKIPGLKDESHPWHSCDVCEEWWCPDCAMEEQVDNHIALCKLEKEKVEKERKGKQKASKRIR